MKRAIAVLCAAALLMVFFPAVKAEKQAFTGMRIYGAGSYAVGENFQAGEYILFNAGVREARYLVSIDEDGLDVITEGGFITNTMLTVEDGDYLKLTDCTAALAEDYYSIARIEPNQNGGTLKVGYDVEPGSYELIGQPDETSFYRLYDDTRFHLVAAEGEFRLVCEVHLEQGQYLELVSCAVGSRISDQSTPAPVSQSLGDSGSEDQAALTPETEKPQEAVHKVRIGGSRALTVRSIPSTKGEKIGTAEAGVEYEMLEAEEKWYKIRLDSGEEGWITSGMAEIIE